MLSSPSFLPQHCGMFLFFALFFVLLLRNAIATGTEHCAFVHDREFFFDVGGVGLLLPAPPALVQHLLFVHRSRSVIALGLQLFRLSRRVVAVESGFSLLVGAWRVLVLDLTVCLHLHHHVLRASQAGSG